MYPYLKRFWITVLLIPLIFLATPSIADETIKIGFVGGLTGKTSAISITAKPLIDSNKTLIISPITSSLQKKKGGNPITSLSLLMVIGVTLIAGFFGATRHGYSLQLLLEKIRALKEGKKDDSPPTR
ncbi:MAG: hypothetical protein KBE27_07265, partial [Syntrophorhabdaceae bacterium]|nr:hypothetical protein [Syntrophorhabdaceae bacterium]